MPGGVKFKNASHDIEIDTQPRHTYMPMAKPADANTEELWIQDMGADFNQECLSVGPAGKYDDPSCH